MKFRLFCHLRLGGSDPDAERVYLWHIEKRSGHRMRAGVPTDKWKRHLKDYLTAAVALHASMSERGFDGRYRVPVDPHGELLDGSHRVACALALGIGEIPVKHEARFVWAPPWGERWFIEHGMGEADLERVRTDYAESSSGRSAMVR